MQLDYIFKKTNHKISLNIPCIGHLNPNLRTNKIILWMSIDKENIHTNVIWSAAEKYTFNIPGSKR